MTTPSIPDGPAPQVWTPRRAFKNINTQIQATRKRGPLLPIGFPLPSYSASQTTVQTLVTANTFIPITVTTPDLDTDSMHSTNHPVVQRAGWYDASGCLCLTKTSSATVEVVAFMSTTPDSTGYLRGTGGVGLASNTIFGFASCGPKLVHLNAGDSVFLLGLSGASSHVTLSASPLASQVQLICRALD